MNEHLLYNTKQFISLLKFFYVPFYKNYKKGKHMETYITKGKHMETYITKT